MTISPLSTSIATLLYAPDTDGGPSGGAAAPAIAVSAENSPTGESIPVTPRTQSSPPVILQEGGTQDPKTAPRVRQKGVETSAAKLLGLAETPQEEAAREAKEFRDRDKSGRFVKQPDIGKKTTVPVEPPKLGEPAKPAPVAKPAPAPVAVAKIKVGDKEMTADEAAARIAELEKAAKPHEPAAAPVTEPDAAAIAATAQAREEKFFADHIADYLLDHADGGDFDQLLAGGEKGAKAFAHMMAKVEMRARQFAASELSKAYDHIDGVTGQFQPVLEQHTLAQQYQSEHQFLESNADIKAHATGLQTMREVSQELHAEHDDLLALMAATPNSPNISRYQARAKLLETEFLPELAKATRAKLNIGTAPIPAPAVPATVPPVAATPVPAAPAKPRPPAPTGNIGGQNSPKAKAPDGGFGDLAAKGFF